MSPYGKLPDEPVRQVQEKPVQATANEIAAAKPRNLGELHSSLEYVQHTVDAIVVAVIAADYGFGGARTPTAHVRIASRRLYY